jgi:hypothetical protein
MTSWGPDDAVPSVAPIEARPLAKRKVCLRQAKVTPPVAE